MSRRLSLLLLTILTLSLLLIVVWYLDQVPRTDDAYVYADTVEITPEVSGRIIELAVRENQQVREGEVLFRIDARAYEDALRQASASLVALNKEIELTQRQVDAQEFNAKASRASVASARAASIQAADSLRRLLPLKAKGYVSAERLEQARTADVSARADLDAALLRASQAEAAVSGVDALVAKRAVLEAKISGAQLSVEHSVVRAPFDGRIVGLKRANGQYAAAGRPLFTMIDSRQWYVVANFRETELAGIRPGSRSRVYLMSDTSRRFSGIVDSVGYGVFPDDGGSEVAGLPKVARSINWVRVAQRFPVRIRVDNADPELFRLGASAVAQIETVNADE
ncbi:multidrug efflux system membrane fusion protein [Pseudomonas fluvialis]|uniref:Multidrug efflux system membrane fusion protein n=1 Tax=Pseudomonas fluvialis TaxID=1793966 RepID=A0A7X0BQW2_9PSED|nr:multidrug transporter subunit MdtN [Pseudomonas fluvialis]MBB6340987.1 multidrug efflux system membrane fusion protein [Pseudomonas fluvialis]